MSGNAAIRKITELSAAESSAPAGEEAPAGEDSREAPTFLMELARALHEYGSPSHRLEATLELLSERLRARGQFFAMPTSIFASFGEPGTQHTSLIRLTPGEVDLERLSRLDRLVARVYRGEEGPAAAREELRRIVEAPHRYGSLVSTLAFAFASGGAARFFGGGLPEICIATASGALIGMLAQAAGRFPGLGRVFVPIASLLISLLAALGAAALAPASPYVATVAGLIILVPGFTLTVAMSELSSGHLASGSTRLIHAAVVFLVIGFAVALGWRVAASWVGEPSPLEPGNLPLWTELLALFLAPLSFSVLFRAHPRQVPAILLVSVLGYAGARFGSAALGPQLGVLIGALVVGIASNVFARSRNQPASVTLVPGIMLLVPGSLGFRSISLLMSSDVLSGVEAAFIATVTAVALATGMLLANAALPARRTL